MKTNISRTSKLVTECCVNMEALSAFNNVSLYWMPDPQDYKATMGADLLVEQQVVTVDTIPRLRRHLSNSISFVYPTNEGTTRIHLVFLIAILRISIMPVIMLENSATNTCHVAPITMCD